MKKVFSAIGLVLLFATACQENPSGMLPEHDDQSGERVRILSRMAGEDAALNVPLVTLITSEEELLRTGASSLAQAPVDFANQTLVVVALGEQPIHGYWVRIDNIQRKSDRLYVQGRANRPSQDATAKKAASYPYEAVVITRQEGIKQVLSEIESVTDQKQGDPFLIAPRTQAQTSTTTAAATKPTTP